MRKVIKGVGPRLTKYFDSDRNDSEIKQTRGVSICWEAINPEQEAEEVKQ